MIKLVLESSLFLIGVPALLILIMRLFGIALQSALLNSSRFLWILAPGTIIHELSHLLVCILFGLPIDKVVLYHPEEDGTLGHVDYEYNTLSFKDRLGASISGFAPIIGISLLEYVIYSKLFPQNISTLINDLKNINVINFIKDFFLPGGNIFHMILFIGLSILLLSGYSISGADLQSVKTGAIELIELAVIISVISLIIPSFRNTIIIGMEMLFMLSLAMIILCMLSLLIIKAFF